MSISPISLLSTLAFSPRAQGALAGLAVISAIAISLLLKQPDNKSEPLSPDRIELSPTNTAITDDEEISSLSSSLSYLMTESTDSNSPPTTLSPADSNLPTTDSLSRDLNGMLKTLGVPDAERNSTILIIKANSKNVENFCNYFKNGSLRALIDNRISILDFVKLDVESQVKLCKNLGATRIKLRELNGQASLNEVVEIMKTPEQPKHNLSEKIYTPLANNPLQRRHKS